MPDQPNRNDQRLEMAMGRMLQIGVTVAAIVVLIGGVLSLYRSSAVLPDYRTFRGAPAHLDSVAGILHGVVKADPASIIGLGILLLIATPICRVILGVIGFAIQRDRFYAAISTVVLAILLLSFFIRK